MPSSPRAGGARPVAFIRQAASNEQKHDQARAASRGEFGKGQMISRELSLQKIAAYESRGPICSALKETFAFFSLPWVVTCAAPSVEVKLDALLHGKGEHGFDVPRGAGRQRCPQYETRTALFGRAR